MAEAVKFTFDEAFDGGQSQREADEGARHAAELEEVRRAAHEAGRVEGKTQALQAIENDVKTLLEAVSTKLEGLFEAHLKVETELRAGAAHLAHVIAGRLAARLIDRFPLVEIDALIDEAFELCRTEPRIVVRVADELLDPLKERIDGLKSKSGFAGSVVLIAEESLARGDCHIEWADGGIQKSKDALAAVIDERVERYFARPDGEAEVNTETEEDIADV